MADSKTVTIMDNGPIEVYGPVTVMDESGKTVVVAAEGEPIYLCRCGGSTTKPLCDGTHDKIGFAGAMKAVADSEK